MFCFFPSRRLDESNVFTKNHKHKNVTYSRHFSRVFCCSDSDKIRSTPRSGCQSNKSNPPNHFATHEVFILGHVFRRIEMAICRLELSPIMKLPEKYHAFSVGNQPKIREIAVIESKPGGLQAQAALN